MPIWKQRMFSRLMNQNDGQGNDLGGGTDEQTTIEEPAGDNTDEPSATEEAANELTEEPSNNDLPTDKPASPKMLALLDEISGDKPAAPKAEEPAAEEKPADEPPATEAKTPEQEEAELLEGVKSERGKDRIRQVFAERKQLEQDMTEFKQLVQGTGMTPQDFAQTLEFGRLVNSGDEKDLRVALEMVEGQRAMLYQRLGVEAPGIDLLKGHDDLKEAVDNMEITRERAVELAKFRKSEAAKAQQQQEQQATSQRQQQFQQTVQNAAGAMEAYLNTRANEVDHPARMKVITAHFQNPANLQAFIQTYEPHQWAATIKMMYDGIVVPKAQPTNQPQPMRSRPANLGNPAPQGSSAVDRLAQHLDNMGI
jgi:hypothetical protein